LLERHCLDCHNAENRKGGLDLENLSRDEAVASNFDAWVKVHDKVRSSEMPPGKQRQLPPAERKALVRGLGAELAAVDRQRQEKEGRAVLRRLNRTEYENTLRDLLGVPWLNVRELLPEDGQAFGYDRSAAGLDLSYVQMAKYMEAADVALDAAIAQHAAPVPRFKYHIPGGGSTLGRAASNGEAVFLKDFKYDASLTPIPRERDRLAAKVLLSKLPYNGTMGVFRIEDESFRPTFPFEAVFPGKYRLRMSVWSFWWDKGEVKPSPRTEAAELLVAGRTLGYFDAPSLTPTVTEIEVWLGEAKSIKDQIQFNAASLKPAQIYYRKGLAAEYTGAGIAVDWLEIEGPLNEEWPPASHRRLFGDLPMTSLPPPPKIKLKDKGKDRAIDTHIPRRVENVELLKMAKKAAKVSYVLEPSNIPHALEFSTVVSNAPEQDAHRLLVDFLPRAFRRPAATEEVERYVGLVRARLAQGDLFEVAMRAAYKAALCSTDFLYREEATGELDHWSMAARLSYLLWNSMPDHELFELARKGRLHDPGIVRGQVERMLRDPKAERFVADFTDQWLDLRDIDATTPDKKLYPEFRRILRDAMLAEPRAFFREMLEKDLSVSNVVHSDFAMLNQRLAEHYGIPGVVGSALRRVPLPAGCDRGGFLTQAAVLKVTANGTDTSPVKRGAWVMRKIVGQPPEPPPPNVPAIEPDVRGTTSIREQLAKHRTDRNCAACHAKIDPPGFALESFDVIGGRRTRYRVLNDELEVVDPSQTFQNQKVRYSWGQKVDAAGELADGRAFADVDGFKQLLLDDTRVIARNLVGQMVTYATGAPVGFADREEVERILDRTRPSDYGMRSLIHEVVQSAMFQRK
jgi:mono/diheme cytochrome c family protein